MWGPKPAEAIIDSIHAKGYARTFTPLATMVIALAGTAMYVANYGTKARELRKEQESVDPSIHPQDITGASKQSESRRKAVRFRSYTESVTD